MNLPRPSLTPMWAFVCLVLIAVTAFGDEWRPIDPAHLAMRAPIVEPNADAEAIFWEVHVEDELQGGTPRTVLRHYIRIKIFTERGRESQSRIDIPYLNNTRITDIEARTVKPDGTITELRNNEIFERTIVRFGNIRVRAKSFAMPGVEPGAIIEYRWREVRNDRLANYVRLDFQREIPVQTVKYFIKPISLPGFPFGMRVQFFNRESAPLTRERNGYHSTTMTNVPAFREEPRMPPEYSSRAWMLVYYAPDRRLVPAEYWRDYGREIHEIYRPRMRPNDDIRARAREVIGDATTDEQKLERLYEFCRTQIRNLDDDISGLTEEERVRQRDSESPADTLRRGAGTWRDVDLLFAALASAAGYEARYVSLSDRSDTFFNPAYANAYFLRTYLIAVRVGENWRFFDPGSRYTPFGMLRWQEEGTQALITDARDPVFVQTPMSPPERSRTTRRATLRLSEDGTLEGDVRVEYTGHAAADMKEENDTATPAERENNLREEVTRRMSGAEISNISIENATDPARPFVYTYRVRVPGYATRTGRRLFIQPAFFQRGVAAVFPTSERRHPVYFHYPWSEDDRVMITLPAGFALDNAEAPSSLSGGAISQYNVRLAVTQDGRTLIYTRAFFFGGGENILFPVTSYAQLKRFFDGLHEQDSHTISLRQGGAAATTNTATPAPTPAPSPTPN